jgi:glycosyltransferase involved in cell wall biosynthesis
MASADANIPSYLKSLESILNKGADMATAAAAAPVVTAAPAVSASTVTEANVSSSIETTPSLSLSSIGFGNMFTGAGTATRGPPPVAATEKSTTDGPEKLRLLIASTHCQQVTGYAKVSHGILTELAKESSWLDVTHFGFQRLPKVPTEFRPLPSTITQLDAAAMERPGGQPQGGFAFSALPDVIRQKKPHVVLIYNDLAVVNQYINAINTAGLPRTFKLWVYADQVYNIQSQMYLDLLNRDVDRIFAFSAGWKKCLKDQGITRPIDVIPHGFTKSQFYSIPKELARQQIMLPKDIFLFLNLNRNQPRKRYDILLMAFVELIVKYPTKPLFLLCICDKGDQQGGWWLFEIFARELKLRGVPVEQFGNRLVVTSQSMSFKDEDINMFYNAADVGITTADGEGWGLCQFEQMGVGVPQVVPDITGFQEFCNEENSMMVKPKNRYYLPNSASPVGGEAFSCDPHDVCLAMEEYVLNSEKRTKHGKAAKEKVLSYTWSKAVETFLKRLRQVRDDDE